MKKFITKSRGQWNIFSKLRTGVSNKGSSIVTQLGSWAFTGRGLYINVYQHFGYKLHLVWNHSWSEMCVERTFLTYADVVMFCTELKKGALEGLCTCVSKGCFKVMEDKVQECFMPTPLPPDWDWSVSESTIKSWQEHESPSGSCCPVKSPSVLVWDRLHSIRLWQIKLKTD